MSDEDDVIDGIYKIAQWISVGGSSQVLECIEIATGRHVAMKLLKQGTEDFKENKAVMKHESEVMKTLEHPLIIKFERYSSSRDNTYIVMEHFRASNVKLQLKSDIRFVQARARHMFESLCSTLSHVHSKGWIHRDIKPDNVLMNRAGEIRLVDFSLATREVKGLKKMMGGGKLKTIQGTRTYIAPETIRKLAPTFQTDLYSLGILFFEVLTGRTPFQAPTPEELLRRHLRDEPPFATEFNPNVTQEMDRLMQRMLKKKMVDRPASIDEVMGELRRIRVFKEDVVDVNPQEEDEKSQSMDALTDIRLDSRADAKLSVMLQANPELARQFAEEKQTKSDKKKREAAHTAERAKKMKDTEKTKKTGASAAPPAPQMPQQMMPVPGFMPQPQFAPFGAQPFGMPPQMPPQMMPGPPGMMPGMGQPAFPTMAPSGFPPPGMPPGPPMGMPPGAPPYPQAPAPSFPQAPGAPPQALPGAVQTPQPGRPPQAAPAPAPVQRPAAAPVQPAAKPPAAKAAAPAKQTAPKPVAKPAPAKPPEPVNPDDLEEWTELPDIL